MSGRFFDVLMRLDYKIEAAIEKVVEKQVRENERARIVAALEAFREREPRAIRNDHLISECIQIVASRPD